MSNREKRIEITVNGVKRRVMVQNNTLLSNLLVDELKLTGARYTCGTGQCGACTVLINGEPVLCCITLAVTVHGADIVTIEGVTGPKGRLAPIQESFLDNAAVQCGYCTPGMILMGQYILNRNPSPTEDEIRHSLEGNLCRCTGYSGIVRAIKNCSKLLKPPK
jgi:carbon-monoxide dehydrogenase small subunit